MSSGVMTFLAIFHDVDEALLTAWKASGIEAGLEVLYDAIEEYDNLMTIIANVFQGRISLVKVSAGKRFFGVSPHSHAFSILAHTQTLHLLHAHTASLGSFLEFAKKIIDKLGEFLCDSGETFTEEAAAITPPPDCGVVGVVVGFIKATVDVLLSFIDGAIDYLIGLLNEALLEAVPELKSLFSAFDFDLYWVNFSNCFYTIVHFSSILPPVLIYRSIVSALTTFIHLPTSFAYLADNV